MPRTNGLRELQAEWNSLVPLAQRAGIPRVRRWTQVPAASWVARDRINWLRNELSTRGWTNPTLQLLAEQNGLTRVPSTSAAALQTAPALAVEPSLDQFTFGVEIEFFLPVGITRRQMAALLTDAGIPTQEEMYGHSTPTDWKLVTDGSLSDYTRGSELVSPVLQGEAGRQLVKRACQALLGAGATVNRHCGFHVHVGAADRGVSWFRKLLRLYAKYEDVIDTLVAPTRRGHANNYCRSTKARLPYNTSNFEAAEDVRQLGNVYNGRSRYYKLNIESFWRHGTVEFRQHQGTINGDKAVRWVLLCLRMVAAATQDVDLVGEETLDGMAEKLCIPQDDVSYFQRRQTELSRIRVTERT